MIAGFGVPRLAAGGVFIALLGAACSSPGDRDGIHAAVDTLPDGRVRVANTGESVWDESSAWTLERDLVLGTADEAGPPEQQFGLIHDLAIDSRGRIHVLDVVAQVVRVFAPDGSYLHDLGRPGEGPGELSGPVEISVGPGDSISVADQRAGSFSLFAPDGSYARMIRQPNGLSQITGRALADGRYVTWGFTFPDGGPAPVHLLPIRFGPAAEPPDTFPPVRFTPRLTESGRPAVYFSAGPTGIVDRDGSIWFAHSDSYEVFRRTLEGDTTLAFTLPAEPHPLEEADRAQVNPRSPLRAEYLAALPEFRPIVGAIVSDGAGHLYIPVDVAGRRQGTTIDVFRDTGVYLGRLELPEPAVPRGPVRATRDHLYVVTSDDLDVQYMTRLRIVRPAN